MKNLANCTPREFLVQTNKIRKSVSNWLELTKVLEIRKTPILEEGTTLEERKAAMQRQVQSNIDAMLDSVLDKYPEETARLLGLICFIEPDDLDNHSMSELLGSISEIIGDENVIGFFISLAKLGNVSISSIRKA